MDLEEQLFGEEQFVIDNTQNVQAQQVENIPETGPYTIRLRDISLQQKELEELFATMNVKHAPIQGKQYEAKTGEAVYTYYVDTEDRDSAIIMLSLNNKKYQGALLNTHYCKPRHDGERRTYERRTFEFNKSQMGTQQQSQQPQYQPFSRELMGTNKQEDAQQQGFALSRNIMGQNKQQAAQAPQHDGEFTFSRNQMGSKKQSTANTQEKQNSMKAFAEQRAKKNDQLTIKFE